MKFLDRRRRAFSRQDWFIALVLLAVTMIAYSPAWNGKPIWDDDEHLTKPVLRSWNGLVQIWTNVGITHQYYPFVHTIFWLEHRLWGDTPFYYHLANILLHVGAALLLVKILRELSVPGSWLAGALFALHPVQVESVAWMSELKNTLSAVFFLSSAFLYLKFDRTRNRSEYLAALGLFLLGLPTKSVIAVLPAAILVVLWWKRGKLLWKRDVLPLDPFFAIGITAGLFTTWVEQNFVGAHGSKFDLSLIERILVAGRAFWFYLWKLFWPANLIFIYPRWKIDPAAWWQYLFPLGALLLFAAFWLSKQKSRGVLAGFLFFVVILFPALGFLNVYPFIYSFVADHFQYLASIGIITITSAGLTTLVDAVPQRRAISAAVFSLLLGTLTLLTWRQAHMYRDEETLWRATLSRNPDCWLAHSDLAAGLVEKGQLDEAIAHYERALTTRPDPETGHYNLAAALTKAGKVDSAILHYREALELSPDYANARYNLGRVLLDKGEIDQAIDQYREALRLRPNDADAHNNLGGALMKKGLRSEAIDHYEAALRLREQDADIQYNLANALAKSGEIDNAVVHYEKALAIRPDHVEARYELGSALLQKGRTNDAVARYQEVLERRPDYVNAHTNLGNLLLQKGELASAIAQYEKSLAIDPNDATAETDLAWVLATCSDASLRNGRKALDLAQRANQLLNGRDSFALRSLAAAYAETGQFAKAVGAAEEAWRLASEIDNHALAQALSKEMEFYKAGLPYRKNAK